MAGARLAFGSLTLVSLGRRKEFCPGIALCKSASGASLEDPKIKIAIVAIADACSTRKEDER